MCTEYPSRCQGSSIQRQNGIKSLNVDGYRKRRGTKKPLKVKEESEKAGLKLHIQKMKIMAFSSTTSWQIEGETMETMRDFILGGSNITADGDCSHEIKRHLLLGRKAMINLLLLLLSCFSRVRLCATP